MILKKYRIAAPTAFCFAVFVLAFAGAASAGETLIARVLDPFAMPKAVAIDPLDDNDETMAAVAVVKAALKERSITVNEDATHVLEIEVDPSARTPYLTDDVGRAEANDRQDVSATIR